MEATYSGYYRTMEEAEISAIAEVHMELNRRLYDEIYYTSDEEAS